MTSLRIVSAFASVSSALAAAVLLAGCGLKGALYLPEDKPAQVDAPAAPGATPVRRPPTPIPAPQAQKKDRASDAQRSVPEAGTPGAPVTEAPLPASDASRTPGPQRLR
jgi:predicted small lipoprotein YifL